MPATPTAQEPAKAATPSQPNRRQRHTQAWLAKRPKQKRTRVAEHGSYQHYYHRRLSGRATASDPRLEHVLRAISRIDVERPAVLDIGCNDGAFTSAVAAAVPLHFALGLDIDQALVNQACTQLAKRAAAIQAEAAHSSGRGKVAVDVNNRKDGPQPEQAGGSDAVEEAMMATEKNGEQGIGEMAAGKDANMNQAAGKRTPSGTVTDPSKVGTKRKRDTLGNRSNSGDAPAVGSKETKPNRDSVVYNSVAASGGAADKVGSSGSVAGAGANQNGSKRRRTESDSHNGTAETSGATGPEDKKDDTPNITVTDKTKSVADAGSVASNADKGKLLPEGESDPSISEPVTSSTDFTPLSFLVVQGTAPNPTQDEDEELLGTAVGGLDGPRARKSRQFPYNVKFRQEDFAAEVAGKIARQKNAVDVVLCLSVTKWVHMYGGDEGLKRLFKRIYDILRPGGVLVLEPQPAKSYKRAKRKGLPGINHILRELDLKPHKFRDYLLGPDVGFATVEVLLEVAERKTKAFNRPILAFYKGKEEKSEDKRKEGAAGHNEQQADTGTKAGESKGKMVANVSSTLEDTASPIQW